MTGIERASAAVDRACLFLAKAALTGIHTTTSAREAYIKGDWMEPGQHLNLVGASLADSREIDDHAVARVTMITDSFESSARESGELIAARQSGAIPADFPVVEIGEVLKTPGIGRNRDDQITAYKSHGLIVQDLAAA